MNNKLIKFKIVGMPTETVFAAMPFGRRLEYLPTIANFQASAKSIHLSQKRQSYVKAIKEAIQLLGAKEYYCSFYSDSQTKDDSFEFWYKT